MSGPDVSGKQNTLTVRGDDTNVNGYRVIDISGNVKALKAGTNMTLIQAVNDITLKSDLNGLTFTDQTTNLNLVGDTAQIQLAIANTATIPSINYNYTNLIATLNGKQSTLAVNGQDTVPTGFRTLSINNGVSTLKALKPGTNHDNHIDT